MKFLFKLEKSTTEIDNLYKEVHVKEGLSYAPICQCFKRFQDDQECVVCFEYFPTLKIQQFIFTGHCTFNEFLKVKLASLKIVISPLTM